MTQVPPAPLTEPVGQRMPEGPEAGIPGQAAARRRPPLVLAIIAQTAALMVVYAADYGLAAAGITPPALARLGLQGIVAALLGIRLGLAPWWLPIQAVLPVAVALGLRLDVPSWVYLAAFAGLLLVYWNSARGGVPLYLTNAVTRDRLYDLLPQGENFTFLDVGSGLGGTLLNLAGRRREGRFDGVESAPIPFALAWLRRRFRRPPNVHLAWGDLWKRNFSGYDVVYAFLSPVPMESLFRKVRAEMRPGTLFISNTFAVPGVEADTVIHVADRRRTRLHVWRM